MILDQSMSLATRLPQTLKQVRPVLSTDHAEARRRVLNLYKIWLRQIPYIRVDYIKNNWTEPRLRDAIKVKLHRDMQFDRSSHFSSRRIFFVIKMSRIFVSSISLSFVVKWISLKPLKSGDNNTILH